MGAISALSKTSRTLKRNTVLFTAAFVVAFVNIVPSGLPFVLSTPVAGLLSFPISLLVFLLSPFFFGGLLSMAAEGIGGDTRFDTFVAGGKDNYLHLLGAMVLFTVFVGILGTVVALGLSVVAIFTIGMNSAGAAGPMAASSGSFGILALLGVVGLIVGLLPVFFLQFYAPAIVISDLGILDSLKRSATLVRRNIVSTLGYSVVAGAVGLVAGIAGFAVSVASGVSRASMVGMGSTEYGLGFAVAAILLSLLASTLVSAFGAVYQVAFYENCLDSLD